MIRVKMKTTLAGPKYTCVAGGILSLDTAAEAQALVDAGCATIVPGQVPPGVLSTKPKPVIDDVETASMEPPESAVRPRGAVKKPGR